MSRTQILTRRAFVALSAGALLSSCTDYSFESSTAPVALTNELILEKINEVRRANGRRPVTYSLKLAAAARSQANLMAARDQISHNLGVTLRERVTAAGYIGAVGEDLAAGHKTLEDAISGWLASPGHRSTLLSNKFTECGLAVARVAPGVKSRYGIYWALIMGGDFAAWQRG